MSRPTKNEGSQFVRYFGPLLDALRSLGGSGTADEVVSTIADDRLPTTPAMKAGMHWLRNAEIEARHTAPVPGLMSC